MLRRTSEGRRPRPVRRRCLGVAFMASALVSQREAGAEPGGRPPSLDLRGFSAPIDAQGGLWYTHASSPESMEAHLASWSHYAWGAVALRRDGVLVSRPLEHQLSGELVASVGFLGRVVLGVDLPYVLYQVGDAPGLDAARALGGVRLPEQALGDLGVVAKATLVRPTSGSLGGFALALEERLTFPTGDEASLLGEGDVTSTSRLLAEYRHRWVTGFLAGGVKLRARHESLGCGETPACKTRFGHEVPFGAALSLKPALFGVDPRERATVFVELHGHLPFDPIAMFDSVAASQLQLGGGARYALRDVSFLAAVEGALVGGVGNAAFRGTFSVGWTPRSHDRDGDGVDDDVDLCVDLAEDRDGFQDQDGCPDLDDDQDGIPDAVDWCPRDAEDVDGFADDDGCPDLDNDQDGIPDAEDACPDQKGLPQRDARRRGCPDAKKNDGAKGAKGEAAGWPGSGLGLESPPA